MDEKKEEESTNQVKGQIRVKKRNGRLEEYDYQKINKCAERACDNLSGVSSSELVLDSKIQFYDKIRTEEIDKTLILTARSKSYKEPNWSYVSARILLDCLYKEIFNESIDCDTFLADYGSHFVKNIKKGVKASLYDERLLDFDLKELSNYIDSKRDFLFKNVGLQNVYDRYLVSLDGKKIETPQYFYMRVAMGLSLNEKNKNQTAKEFYDIFSLHLASPSTPTLFNSGTNHNQLSSCFLTEIDDSIDGIFDGLWQEARKSKYAGGLGFHVSKIRGMNSSIHGTNGKSSGLIPWLKIFNDMLIACDQAGKRPGSGCAYIEPWHIDVEEFINLRKVSGEERRKTHDLNIALWMPDLFFQRVKDEENWTLFCPSEVKDLPDLYGRDFNNAYEQYEKLAEEGKILNYKKIPAKNLWRDILEALFETSHPWILHKDNFNYRYTNIHEGILHGSNLCTEISLHTKHSKYKDGEKVQIGETAVCNLGSVCLPNHLEKDKNGIYKFNYKKLTSTISLLVRGLDNVIDLNYYPTKEAKNSNLKHRPIGMGTMGWADVYAILGIVQDSDEGIKVADELMEFISQKAILTSSQLAKERGKYSTYSGSKWDNGKLPIDTYKELLKFKNENFLGKEEDETWKSVRDHIKDYGMRNSNVMAIAPNASIAYQLGCEQSHEPFFKPIFRYENKSGNYFIINSHFVYDLMRDGLWSQSVADSILANDGEIGHLDIPQKYKDIYKVCFDRDMFKILEGAMMKQKWIDQAISTNIYNGKTSKKYLNDVYTYSNKIGLKSTYYLRNKPASSSNKVSAKDTNEPKTTCSIEDIQNNSCETCEG